MPCFNCQNTFNVRPEDLDFYKAFDAPAPTLCPDCRLQQRLCFRNERTLYSRTSALSGKKMISIYKPECRYPVYSPDEWWSDKWEGLDYGRPFDFSRPFFEQFQELLLKVPRIGLFNVNPTNSDYCQQAYNNKNCYLCMVLTHCEDSMYLSHSNHIKDSYDCTYLHHSELCYECLDSEKLYNCIGCQSCQNSSNLFYSYDCIGCQDCFGCWGLRNKKNHIFNKPYSPEEYKQKVASLELHKFSNFTKYRDYFQQVSKDRVNRATRNLNTVDSTGNYLINVKNGHECFDSFQIEDSAYCTWIFTSHHCQDVYGLGGSDYVLNCVGNENVHKVAFNTFVSDGGDVFYSDLCFYSTDLFGCSGLKNKKFCILNKQYSEAEYKTLRAQIVTHMKKTPSAGSGQAPEWGQFFPISLSPYAYNETAAQNIFPLTKEAAITKDYPWKDPDPKEYKPQTYVIPDDIKTIQPEICDAILACTACKKNYKIVPQELKFYQSSNLPIPRKCPDCRYGDRLKLRSPRKLYIRACDQCKKEMQTTYAPEYQGKVYCEKCYLETVS